MRGIQVSELELNISGGLTVKDLATIFEDGEVVGESYLASSLRKAVEARGPASLDTVVRLYNNGYYGASWIDKGRVYLKEGQKAPAGMRVKEGPRGGRYYDTGAGRGRPLSGAPEGWRPKEGDRVRLRIPGDKRNGRLARVREIHVGEEWRAGKVFAVIDGIGWSGGGYMDIEEGMLVPAPYTGKEKKEMKVRDILIEQFGKTSRSGGKPFRDDTTELDYDIFDTEAGPLLWIKSEPGEDKPWAATKESAVALESFMKALLEMPTEALQSMKSEVQSIIFSPVSNPHDRATSQSIGAKFTSAASMDMQMRVMHIWPASKANDAKRIASTLVHETGHALDAMRNNLVIMYNSKRRKFWEERGEEGGFQTARTLAIEAEHGFPPAPDKWEKDYHRWRAMWLATSDPNATRWWPDLKTEKSWNELSWEQQEAIKGSAENAYPVSTYAQTSNHEYYAEAYLQYQVGLLPTSHIMQEHFETLESVRQWIQE